MCMTTDETFTNAIKMKRYCCGSEPVDVTLMRMIEGLHFIKVDDYIFEQSEFAFLYFYLGSKFISCDTR